MKTTNTNLTPKALQLVFAILLLLFTQSFLAGQSATNQKNTADSLLSMMASLAKSSENQSSKMIPASNALSASASAEFANYELMEEKLVLEDWMLDPHHSSWSAALEPEEEDIKLEPWMLDLSTW